MVRLSRFTALVAVLLAAGCMTAEDRLRYDGVTGSAGNAMAANSVLQIVDPWPYGVQDTDLEVPAERPEPAEASDDDSGSTPVTLD